MIVQRCNAAVVFSLLPADRGQKLWDFGEGAPLSRSTLRACLPLAEQPHDAV